MNIRNLACLVIGHELKTAVHAREPTLWCARCKTVQWFVHQPSGLIMKANATARDLAAFGIK